MIRIGISGWTYAGWRGKFYPKGLRQSSELAFASGQFPTIEINGTHYSLQTPKSFLAWKDQTPPDFVFSVKGGRYITHLKRLREVEIPLANFLASGVLALGEKLGPFLWQLPPNFRWDPGRIEEFLSLLPRTTTEAAALARRHSDPVKDRCWLQPGRHRRLRHCLEIRHPSFMVPEFFELLRRHNCAFVFADTAGKWPYAEDVTADFVYIRLHGDEELYASGYGEAALKSWAARIEKWSAGSQPLHAKTISSRPPRKRSSRDVYVYFDNDIKVKAPGDALALTGLLLR